MRFNAKKQQEQLDERNSFQATSESSMKSNLSNTYSLNLADHIKNNKGQLTPIDILTVDSHSRITLTKKFKKIMPIEPSNKITVYQDHFSKSIVFEIQTEGLGSKKSTSTYLVTKVKGKSVSLQSISRSTTGSDKSSGDKLTDSEESDFSNDDLHYQDTLSNIPILLVEDDKDILQSNLMLLKAEGYSNVKTFSDSREALLHVVNPKYSQYYRLVITDIRMPGINGMNLYRILKILNPSIMAIFATGLDAAEEVMSVYPEINARDIIGKPASREMFIKTIMNKISTMTLD